MRPMSDERQGFDVADAPDRSRFELRRDGELVSYAVYRADERVVVVPDVETVPEHRGQGMADRLMEGVVDLLRRDGRTILPLCSWAAGYLRAHPEHHDVVQR